MSLPYSSQAKRTQSEMESHFPHKQTPVGRIKLYAAPGTNPMYIGLARIERLREVVLKE